MKNKNQAMKLNNKIQTKNNKNLKNIVYKFKNYHKQCQLLMTLQKMKTTQN